MRILAAVGLAGACFATSPLFAADLFDSAPPPMDAPTYQTELGANWYIRGDVGYGQTKEATVVPSAGLFPSLGNAPIGNASSPVNAVRGNYQSTQSPSIDLGFGYRVNDYFRIDADWQLTKGPGLGYTQSVYCPEVANAVSNYNTESTTTTSGGVSTTTSSVVAVPVGYAYDYTKCDGKLNVSQYNNTALVMGYVDLGHWGMFTPFIGIGGGLNANTITGSVTYNQQDTGQTYAGAQVTGTAPAQWVTQTGTQNNNAYYTTLPYTSSGNRQPIGAANWNRSISSTKYSFAAAAAAGLDFKISQSATLELAYKIMTFDVTNGLKNSYQGATIGVRYNIN